MKNGIIIVLLLGFLAGCSTLSSQSQSPAPTPYPPDYLPTVIALTADAASLFATATSLASQADQPPTDTPEPTVTFTPAATNTPTSIPGHDPAAIEIQSPGPMSKVISPINLRMNIVSGETEKIQIDLYGEDGRLLSRTVKSLRRSSDGVDQVIKIPFEIRAAAEVARLAGHRGLPPALRAQAA